MSTTHSGCHPVDPNDQARNAKLLDQSLQQIGFGRYQWNMWVVCGFGWVCDNMWSNTPSIVLAQVQTEFRVSDALLGFGASSMFIGQFCGALIWGSIADRVGRRPVYLLTLVITAILGLALIFSPSFWFFCLLLSLLGLGIGGNAPASGAMFIECVPGNSRTMLTLMTIWWNLGYVLIVAFGWALLPNNSCSPLNSDCNWRNNKGWRYTIFASTCVTVVIILGRLLLFRMPESAKYYLAQGDLDLAVRTLQNIAQRNGKADIDLKLSVLPDSTNNLSAKNSSPITKPCIYRSTLETFTPLFASPKEALTSILVILIWAIGGLGGGLFSVFLPVFLADFGRLPVNDTYRNYLIQLLCAFLGILVARFACDCFLGRKWTMALTSLGTGGFILLFTISKMPNAQLAFNCGNSFLSSILGGAIYTYTSEVFPVAHRGTGIGLASGVSKLMSAFAGLIGGRLIAVDMRLPLYLSAGLFGLKALCAIALPVETRKKARDVVDN